MKKFSKLLIMSLLSVGLLAGCGGNPKPENGNKGDDVVNPVDKKIKVKYYSDSQLLETKEVEVGSKLPKPLDPTKDDFFFNGWYLDSQFTRAADFNTNVGEQNINLYAKFVDAKTAFLSARSATLGEESKGFAYNYNVHLEAKLANIQQALNGIQTGVCEYNNSSSTDSVNYYDHHENSGSLFYDGFLYQAKTNTKLQKIRLNQDKKVTSVDDETVEANYKYGSSTFAKLLFEYKDEDIKKLEKAADGKYEVKTSVNASKIISILLDNIDNKLVKRALGVNIPNTKAECVTYVTFNNQYLDSYEYVFKVNVSAIQLTLSYKLDFTKVNSTSNIVPQSFPNAYLKGTTGFNNGLETVNNVVDQYKKLNLSSYHADLKTGVDYGFTTNEINSHFNTNTKHQLNNGVLDYVNKVEVDSDFKNADLYKAVGIEDLTYYRGVLENDEVWDAQWKTFGTKNHKKVETPRVEDEYFLYPSVNEIYTKTNISFVEVEKTKDSTIYSLGLEQDTAKLLMAHVNESALLNPYCDANVKVLGDYNESTIKFDKLTFTIELDENNNLKEIKYVVKGEFNTKFIGSRDFNVSKDSDFNFTLTLTPNALTEYNIPKDAGDFKAMF